MRKSMRSGASPASLARALALAGAFAVAAVAGQASAANLTHSYDFSTSVGGSIFDGTGSANGTLTGGASVGGGVVALNGIDGSVDFGADLIPVGSAAFSIYLRVQGTPNLSGYTEILSQGYSSQPGFYIGTAPGGAFRFGDQNGATVTVFPSGEAFHDILLTSGAGGLDVSLDGTHIFSGVQATINARGDFTRLGRQFSPFGEYFQGSIDTLKIFDGVATERDLGGGIPEPASWALMILGFVGVGAGLRRARERRAITA